MIEFNVDFKVSKRNIPEDINKNFEKLMMDLADKILEEATRNLEIGGQWVTGHLSKSGQTSWEEKEQEAHILFKAPYASAVEYGSKPHIAPLGPSIAVKLPSRKGGKIELSGTPDKTDNPFDYWAEKKGETEVIRTKKYGYHIGLAFGVWIKIMKKGGDAHPYMRPAIDKVKAFLGFFARKYGFEVS